MTVFRSDAICLMIYTRYIPFTAMQTGNQNTLDGESYCHVFNCASGFGDPDTQ